MMRGTGFRARSTAPPISRLPPSEILRGRRSSPSTPSPTASTATASASASCRSASDPQAWLVDTLAVRDLEPLRPMFEGPQLKVLHGADYDLSCLFRDFEIRFSNVFDTMIAAQLLGREQLGLAALVREFFGVELDKTLTRHDWGSRPLEPRHLRYLVDDVVHLTGVLERLVAELDAQDLERGGARSSSSACSRRSGRKAPFDPEGFRSIRGAHTLDRQSLSILRELYLLRDRLAARADKPPFKVFGNHQLLEIATTAPRDFDALRARDRVPRAPRAAVRARAARRRRRRAPQPVPGPVPPPVEGPAAVRDQQLVWVDTLKAWRREASARDRRTTMAILPNHLLHRLAELRPTTLAAARARSRSSASAASSATASRSCARRAGISAG